MTENKRLAMLEKMAASGKADAFALYALGMEYRREKRFDDAVRTWQTLRDKDPNYLPQYLMAGQVLIEAGKKAEAGEWLRSGIDVAQKVGDMKARGELESALAEVG